MIEVLYGGRAFEPWAYTKNLACDDDGRVTFRDRDDDDSPAPRRQQIESAQVPEALKPELEALREAWAAAVSRSSLEAEWNADYWASR